VLVAWLMDCFSRSSSTARFTCCPPWAIVMVLAYTKGYLDPVICVSIYIHIS
jgi:hypothetical protein